MALLHWTDLGRLLAILSIVIQLQLQWQSGQEVGFQNSFNQMGDFIYSHHPDATNSSLWWDCLLISQGEVLVAPGHVYWEFQLPAEQRLNTKAACVCVCVCERERERDLRGLFGGLFFQLILECGWWPCRDEETVPQLDLPAWLWSHLRAPKLTPA